MTQQAFVDEHLSSPQSPEGIDDDDMSKVAAHIVDSDSRTELLERNLRYIQQQHELTLIDLHNEINRLQQENKDLHYRLVNTHSSPEQEPKNTDQLSSLIPDKTIDQNHFHFEQKIDELEKQLFESEEKNEYLMHKIDELDKILSSKSEVSHTDDNKISTQKIDNDYQYLLTTSYEKQQEYIQEITKLRSVLVEILNSERLSIASKVLVRDCLTSTTISEISMSKTTTTPIDALFTNEKQQQRQRYNPSPTTNGKTTSFRQSNSQHRLTLPSVIQRNHSSLLPNPTYASDSSHHTLSPTSYSQNQCLIKFGETPIARRERRTQELQKNRLMKYLYH